MEDLVNNFDSDDDEVNLHNEPLSIKKRRLWNEKYNIYSSIAKYIKKRIQLQAMFKNHEDGAK